MIKFGVNVPKSTSVLLITCNLSIVLVRYLEVDCLALPCMIASLERSIELSNPI